MVASLAGQGLAILDTVRGGVVKAAATTTNDTPQKAINPATNGGS
jgi:hypothetical protein